MGATGTDWQRETLFERGSAAFRRATGTDEDVYYCPICQQAFDRGVFASKTLTLEHVPPKSLGGRVMALTCTDCQKLGSRQDAAVKEPPFVGLQVYLRTAIVVLPWPDAESPYIHLEEGPLKLEGSHVDWPRGMEMVLDFHDSEDSAN